MYFLKFELVFWKVNILYANQAKFIFYFRHLLLLKRFPSNTLMLFSKGRPLLNIMNSRYHIPEICMILSPFLNPSYILGSFEMISKLIIYEMMVTIHLLEMK